MVDPGFGFGRTLEHNVALLRALRRFTELVVPLVAGLSAQVDQEADRARGTGGARARLARGGAYRDPARRGDRARGHDVAETKDALAVWVGVGPEPSAKAAPAEPKIWVFEDD